MKANDFPLAIGTLILVLLWAAGLSAQEARTRNIVRDERPGASRGKSLAILIGVEDYTSLPKLKYCHDDVRLLEKTLKENCQYDRVITLTEDSENRSLRPTLGNLSTQLRIWLRVANNGEYQRVLLYFSGHGFRDSQGRLYFAPPDCDRQDLPLTGLPQSLVKQLLDGCTRVPVKLLVLDCCHAGEGRGEGVGESSSKLAGVFRSAKGLLTLASCLDDEVSLEWEAKQHGLFTYWLCQGLKGGGERRGGSRSRLGDRQPRAVSLRVQPSAGNGGRSFARADGRAASVERLARIGGIESRGRSAGRNDTSRFAGHGDVYRPGD